MTSATITLDPQRKLYVLRQGDGFSCFGYDNARAHANLIAQRLNRPDLRFADGDHGTEHGYRKYREAIAAWARSPMAERAYFDPGTDPQVERVLERCGRRGSVCRLILGDVATGEPWFDERDVVGRIGRSTGSLKVPLLVPRGENGGPAMLTACLLAVVDWRSGRLLYRHPRYQEPALDLRPDEATMTALRWWCGIATRRWRASPT